MFFPILIISIGLLDASSRSRRHSGFEMDLNGLAALGSILPCNSMTRCNGKGVCEGSETSSICVCFPGWTGEYCEMPSTLVDPFHSNPLIEMAGNPFNSFGAYNNIPNEFNNHELFQNPFHHRHMPEQELCSAYDCSGHGVCFGTKYEPMCRCNFGRTGSRCEFEFSA